MERVGVEEVYAVASSLLEETDATPVAETHSR